MIYEQLVTHSLTDLLTYLCANLLCLDVQPWVDWNKHVGLGRWQHPDNGDHISISKASDHISEHRQLAAGVGPRHMYVGRPFWQGKCRPADETSSQVPARQPQHGTYAASVKCRRQSMQLRIMKHLYCAAQVCLITCSNSFYFANFIQFPVELLFGCIVIGLVGPSRLSSSSSSANNSVSFVTTA